MKKIFYSLPFLFFVHLAVAQNPTTDQSSGQQTTQSVVLQQTSDALNLQNLPKPPKGTIPESLRANKVQKKSPEITITDISKPVVLADKQKFLVINLQSNATTGYSWFLQNYDHNILVVHSHQYIAPNVKLAGAPGVEQWNFDVNPTFFTAPQSTMLTFVYKRPWENTAAKSQQVEVIS